MPRPQQGRIADRRGSLPVLAHCSLHSGQNVMALAWVEQVMCSITIIPHRDWEGGCGFDTAAKITDKCIEFDVTGGRRWFDFCAHLGGVDCQKAPGSSS